MRARLQTAAIAIGLLASLGMCFALIVVYALSRSAPLAPTPTPEPTVPVSVLQLIKPEKLPEGVTLEVVADHLDRPVAFAVAPDGRIFFTEKESGNVRVIVDDRLLPNPVLTLPVATHGEQGLIGIAVDPGFAQNHGVWVYHTLPARANDQVKVNRIVRFVERNNVGMDVTPVFTSANSEGDGTHNAGNLHFGPDGKLYVSIGEDNQAELAQRLDDPRGKILRFNPTVLLSAPKDNSFYDGDGLNFDGIYTYGHRNPFDFTFDPFSAGIRIFVSENGPDCDDEINLIVAGNNYGWRPVTTATTKQDSTRRSTPSRRCCIRRRRPHPSASACMRATTSPNGAATFSCAPTSTRGCTPSNSTPRGTPSSATPRSTASSVKPMCSPALKAGCTSSRAEASSKAR